MFNRFLPALKSKKFLGLLAISLLILLGLLASFFVPPAEQEVSAYTEAVEEIRHLRDNDYQKYFTEKIDVFYKGEGINGMVQRLILALAEGQITMFECHSLGHDMGHYGGYPDNFKNIEQYISKENLDFCGSGFMHGVEGELANETYPENVEKLYAFCKLVLPKNPYYGGCYHGAGHSFMEVTRNVHEALKQCDLLKQDEVVTVTDCYRGVFSEHSNFARNMGKDDQYLVAFCSSLPQEMQFYCAQELNGLELPATATLDDINNKLKICVEGEYSETVELGCIRSVAGIAADQILGQGNVIMSPEIVHTLPESQMREYIQSTHGSFIKTSAFSAGQTLDAFCSSFHNEEDQNYCRGLGGSM